MRKSWIIIGVIILILFILYGWIKGQYNNMVNMEEAVTAQWQQVENVYQSRADKTKNLVEIVKGAANFESKTLTDVMEARASATSIRLDAEDLTPEKLAAFEAAQARLGQSLGRLFAVAENYPQLQAVGAFRDFQAQYEGMENRIAVERKKFNEMAQQYNAYVRRFPNNMFAGMFGFEKKPYFEAQEGAERAPDIKF